MGRDGREHRHRSNVPPPRGAPADPRQRTSSEKLGGRPCSVSLPDHGDANRVGRQVPTPARVVASRPFYGDGPSLNELSCGPQGYVAVDHLCSVSGHLRSVPEEEGLAGRFDDLRCHRREVVDLADAFNLSEESVDEAEVAAGDAGDRGDGGGLSQVVFVRVLI